MKRLFLLAFVTLASSCALHAQPWIMTWGGADNDVAGAIEPAGDGGFFAAGTRTHLTEDRRLRTPYFIARFDALGRHIWDRSFGDGMSG